MKCRVLIILCIWVFNVVYDVSTVDMSFNSKLNDYLDKKYDVEKYLLHSKNKLLHKRDLANISLTYSHQHQAKMFSFDDDIYLLLENRLFNVSPRNGTYITVPTNFSLNKIKNGDQIQFSRASHFGGSNILLVKLQSGVANIYNFTKTSIEYVHSLLIPESRDAHFFVNNQHLYLVVANNKGDHMAVTSVYKWLGSHFDEIQPIFTIGAIKVTSFSTGKSEILIILQTLPNRTVFSEVYEFKEDQIIKIQQLDTKFPVDFDVYGNEAYNFVLISENSTNSLFKWNGYELYRISQFITDGKPYKNIISRLGNRTVVLSFQKDKIQIYHIFPTSIKLADKYSGQFYSHVFDIYKRENGSSLVTFTIGLTKDNVFNIRLISFTVDGLGSEVDSGSKKDIHECFNNLESMLYEFRRKQNATKTKLIRFKLIPGPTKDFSEVIVGENLEKENNLEEKVKNVEEKLSDIKNTLEDYKIVEDNNMTVNGSLVIKGTVIAEKVLGKNVEIITLNEKKWTPEQWLKYREPQTISGPVKISNLTTEHLETSFNDPLLKDLLLKTGNRTLSGNITATKVIADNIYTDKINDIIFSDIYLQNDSQPIRGKKIFNTLEANIANITNLTGSVIPGRKNRKFGSNLVVDDLQVENINGVSWNEFTQSIFRVGFDDTINGSLSFVRLKTENLTLKTLKDEPIQNFLTTSTDQVIDASVKFNRIYAENITASTVNGLDLKSVVSLDEPFPVKVPVSFDKLYTENLELLGKFNKAKFAKHGDHIVGTNESDFLQIYNGKVKITGNLVVKNLTFLPTSHLFVSGEEIMPNITDNYWTKSTDQIIPVKVTAENGIKVPHILVTTLNDIKFDQYMATDADNSFETDFEFENVTVFGDVTLNNFADNNPDLNKLNKEAIKTNGSYIINGKKTYIDTLKTENLVTVELDGIKVIDALNKKYPINVKGTKTFKNLIIKENLIGNIEHLDILNNKDISRWNESIISIDEPQSLASLQFKDLKVTHLHVKNINGHPVEEYTSKLDNFKAVKKIKNVIIQNNLTLNNVKNVSTINDVKFSELLNKPASPIDPVPGSVSMDVTITGMLKADNLVTNIINDVDLVSLTSRLLYRDAKQNITGPYSFTRIKADNINTPKINNIVVSNLIDIRSRDPQLLIAPGGVQFNSVKLLKCLETEDISPCSIRDLIEETKNPKTQNWHKLEVFGNVTLWDEESSLYRLFERTVRYNQKNTVLAPVKFTKNVSALNLRAKKNINDVNILQIIKDAVFKSAHKEQVIAGRKIVNNIHAKNVFVEKNADIPFVNNEDIEKLNNEIVDKNTINNTVIRGMKTFFSGLQTDSFYSDTVNDVEMVNVVDLENPKKIRAIMFDTLKINNDFNVSYVNNINFNNVLENRLLLTGPVTQVVDAVYFFDEIEIENLTTPSINNIQINDVVFDNKQQQNISGRKYFMNKVEVFGNVNVDYINTIDITKEYEHAIVDENLVIIDGSITVLRPSSINSSITAEYINGFPVAAITKILATRDTGTEIERIHDVKGQIIESIKRNVPIVQDLSTEYMYLEKSDAFQVSVPNTIRASTITSKGYVLIHITGETNGDYCSLPSQCLCPIQHTIGISPGKSVTDFPSKGSQRIFSYDDSSMLAHFITNSVSRSSECRTDTVKVINEASMLSWNTLSTANNSGSFYQYNEVFRGYISKVEFFTLNGKTYVIVGKYFDPVTETYDLDSVVIKFNEERTSAIEIQKIPTKGVEELYIFHTAQGVILIVGNIKANEEETQIYQFDADTEQFRLLRTIPWFGCSGATGVVFGSDSLIILRHRLTPVQILKYYPQFNNYYHYQSFDLDEPVIAINVFYSAGFGISDAYMCLVTSNENYYIYTYKFMEGWKLVSNDHLEGLRNLIPLELNGQVYLFAPSRNDSSLLTVIKNGSV